MTPTEGDTHQPGVTDQMVPGPRGSLFVRTWEPAAPAAPEPIVLLHDSLGCVDLWRGFPADLSVTTGRSVVAYDRLGFGRSDANPRHLDLDFIASEGPSGLELVLEHLGIEGWIGFGHSVGGGMAICAASTVRGCIATVTESAQAFVEQRTAEGIREAKAGFARPGQIERLERYHGGKARWVLDAWTETWLDPAFAAWSLDDHLPAVATPVLAIHGELDEYGSPAHPERIAQLAGGPARAVLLPGVHHVPHREVPGIVIGLVTELAST